MFAPCCKVNMLNMTSKKRAWGMVPRLGPAGFSLVMVCRGTGWIPGGAERIAFNKYNQEATDQLKLSKCHTLNPCLFRTPVFTIKLVLFPFAFQRNLRKKLIHVIAR